MDPMVKMGFERALEHSGDGSHLAYLVTRGAIDAGLFARRETGARASEVEQAMWEILLRGVPFAERPQSRLMGGTEAVRRLRAALIDSEYEPSLAHLQESVELGGRLGAQAWAFRAISIELLDGKAVADPEAFVARCKHIGFQAANKGGA